MSEVYGSTLKFFALKAAREFRPAWLRAAPNLALHGALGWAERRGALAPRLRHRYLRPVSVAVQVTRHCNYRCEFCTVNELVTDGDGTSALTLAEFEHLLQQPLLSRCARLSLTGGEPLLAPEFFEIVEAAKRRIPIVTVNTNFSLVKPNLARLNRSGLDMINVSLYQPNQSLVKKFGPQLSDRIYRRLSFVVNEREPFHHFSRIPEVARLAVEAGFQALYLQNYLPPSVLLDHRSPRLENADALAAVDSGNASYRAVQREVEERFGRELAIAWPAFPDAPSNATARPRCRQPDTQIMIDRDGALAPCCILDADRRFGNALSGKGWNSDEFVAVRRGLKVAGAPLAEACRQCPFVYTDMFDA